MTQTIDHQAQVNLCKYFFENCCTKRTILKSNFGKSTIEQFFATYIHQTAFAEALLLANAKTRFDKHGDFLFNLAIEKQFKHEVLFLGWQPAPARWSQLNNLQ